MYDFTDSADDMPPRYRPEPFKPNWWKMAGAAICGISAVIMAALIASLILWLLFGSTEAKAQSLCQPWSQVKKSFKERFNEEPVSTGISGGKWIVQVIASPNGETFTIFMIDRLGIACAMISGQDWEPGNNPVKSETRL